MVTAAEGASAHGTPAGGTVRCGGRRDGVGRSGMTEGIAMDGMEFGHEWKTSAKVRDDESAKGD